VSLRCQGGSVSKMRDADQGGRMLRVREVAAALGLDPWSIYQMSSSGVLPAYRIGPRGRSLRFAEADVQAYLATRRGLPSPRGA
jgi:excisionase family DNA binding protein